MNQKHYLMICLLLLVAALAFTFQNTSAWQLQQQSSHARNVTNPPPEPQDDKTVKLSANLTTVIAGVSDAAGVTINDLAQNDFELFEDDVQQNISNFFREGEMPLRLVFLFDTSSSIRSRLSKSKRAASLFFQKLLRPGDEAAIMSVSTDPKLENQFTSDSGKLVRTINQLQAEGATALYSAMIDAARYLRTAKGRHAIVILSDGKDTASLATFAQALAEVQKSDAVIYAVHSMGIAPSAKMQDRAGEFALKAMSEDTGGRAFIPPVYDDEKKEPRDPEEIYGRVIAELRAQYVLTYYSKNQARDGRFQSIRVRVNRPGLQVRARRGYYTVKAK